MKLIPFSFSLFFGKAGNLGIQSTVLYKMAQRSHRQLSFSLKPFALFLVNTESDHICFRHTVNGSRR
jgi:hypothetical protein